MPKVIMTCGKICSGKSTYAQKLRLEYSAVILSVDEITLALSVMKRVKSWTITSVGQKITFITSPLK